MTGNTFFTSALGFLVMGLGPACAGAPESSRPLPTPTPLPKAQIWATASQSTVPLELLSGFRPDAEHCLESRTCPFEGASVPPWQTLASDPATLGNVGRKVRIRGRLQSELGTSTQRGCRSDAPCCNRVHGLMSLATPEGRVVLSSSDAYNDPRDSFRCIGDVSAVCCGFAAMGDEAIAEGTLRDLTFDEAPGVHERYLHVTGLCRIGGVSPESTNLAKIRP